MCIPCILIKNILVITAIQLLFISPLTLYLVGCEVFLSLWVRFNWQFSFLYKISKIGIIPMSSPLSYIIPFWLLLCQVDLVKQNKWNH